MSAPAKALPPLEVPVRRGSTMLARQQLVGIHRQTHRTARLAPLQTGGVIELVETFALGLRFDLPGARHFQRLLDSLCHALAVHHRSGSAQVLDTRICARTDKHAVELDSG